MKKALLLLVSAFFAITLTGQAPAQINYQGVARNAAGNVMPQQNIKLRLSIRDGGETGPVVYQETRSLKTNNFGMFTVAIGSPGEDSKIGTLNGVNWAGSTGKFLQVELDPKGGISFIDMGTAQLLSVPFAMHAGSATPSGQAGGGLSGNFPNPGIANAAVGTSQIKDGAITYSKLAPGLIPSTLPPSGAAGGDLNGSYPLPSIRDNAVTTNKVSDGAITSAKLAAGVIPTTLPPSGTASGDLAGSYPAPVVKNNAITTAKIVDGAVTTAKLQDGSVTADKLAPGLIIGGGGPSGTAGGDLAGSYPNPTIKDNAITTSRVSDGAITSAKLAAGVIPTTLPPSGSAGGDLNGSYPSPTIKDNVITTTKISNGAVTTAKLAAGVIPATLPPSGSAGGDLGGIYPNPSINNNAVTTAKIADAAITAAKLAPGVIPATLPPSGSAGGDLNGSYPNPTIKDNVITTTKVSDGAITSAKLAAGVIPTTLPPSGSAGGDLTGSYPAPVVSALKGVGISSTAPATGQVLQFDGTNWAPGTVTSGSSSPSGPAGGDLSGSYPNPNIASGSVTNSKIANGAVITPKIADGAVNSNKIADAAVSSAKLADGSVTTIKIADGAVTADKIAAGVIPGTLPPSGTAGGDLTGSYPSPVVAGIRGINISTTAPAAGQVLQFDGTKWTPGTVSSGSSSPSGPAGGDLTGTYPNPTINTNAITTTKIADGSVTTAKLAAGVIPTALPPNGTAGGDLTGSYPSPVVAQLRGINISSTAPTSGQVLKFDGTNWAPGTDATGGGGFSLPYSSSATSASALFSISNLGAGNAIEGINSSTSANAVSILGTISSASAGSLSAAVKGINNGTGGGSYGVWGSHAGSGSGVYGVADNGTGVQGTSVNGYGLSGYSTAYAGVFGSSNDGVAGLFDISNVNNFNDAVFVNNAGFGNGITSYSTLSSGVLGVAMDIAGAGVYGVNIAGGEAVLGYNNSTFAGALVGRNDGGYAGVRGVSGADGGIGVLAQANTNGMANGNALVAELEGAAAGNTAVFKANSANVARIDNTGKGFFNGGTQVGGADVAEYFAVEGSRAAYEAGDVLVISESTDRTVVRSSEPYSTLVAGVYATKPGLYLTEENAEQDQLQQMVPMGVIGVIPTKVCLEGGAIRRGDLLVTSSIPGVAMKADPDKVKVGQVLGKALQDYNSTGTGKINVLVSVK